MQQLHVYGRTHEPNAPTKALVKRLKPVSFKLVLQSVSESDRVRASDKWDLQQADLLISRTSVLSRGEFK